VLFDHVDQVLLGCTAADQSVISRPPLHFNNPEATVTCLNIASSRVALFAASNVGLSEAPKRTIAPY
jgi:hypothetical protein